MYYPHEDEDNENPYLITWSDFLDLFLKIGFFLTLFLLWEFIR